MDIPELSIPDHAERRAALMARFGEPARFPDTAAALRLLGKRGEIHPDDAMAYLYPSRECAEAFAEANLRYHGSPSLGPVEHDGGWLGVTDLRPQLTRIVPPEVADDGAAAWYREQRAAS